MAVVVVVVVVVLVVVVVAQDVSGEIRKMPNFVSFYCRYYQWWQQQKQQNCCTDRNSVI